MRRPSRSHWIAEPATNTLPSSAYSTRPPAPQAIVVSSPCFDGIARSPVFISMKQPVPYVFFAIPGSKHPCPNSAACWSPAAPAIGTSQPKNASGAVRPYTSDEGRTSGSIAAGTPSSRSSSSSHSSL